MKTETQHGGPSEKAVETARVEISRGLYYEPGEELPGESKAHSVAEAMHDPSLGLDRSVCARDVLVPLYRVAPQEVARLCDDVLDRSGRLLGEVRLEARRG